MKTTRVEINIEELIIHEAMSADRGRISAGVQRELTRLLRERGIPAGVTKSRETKALRLDPTTAPQGAGSEAEGAGVARVVYGALEK